VQRSLEQAGLIDQVATLSARAGDGIDMRLEEVPFDRLIAWITQIEPVWGYRLVAFRIERGNGPGLVTARFEMAPAQ
jgi:type II secretory pathway component PulM